MKSIVIILLLLTSTASASWTRQMDSLARITEATYKLPHGTCRAFATQESSCRADAHRVETGYFNEGSRYYRAIVASSTRFAQTHKWADAVTEQAYESISFGLFQIMGVNLRALGYDSVRLPAITIVDQFHYFGLFVSDLFRRYHTLARVASAYNTGSPNRTGRTYVKRILRFQKQFSY